MKVEVYIEIGKPLGGDGEQVTTVARITRNNDKVCVI